ncbi:MAG TPA: hypothetical protein VHC01_04690 [Gaiellaceae bacterium]|jgi:hypothetical protein|nr:hypothetical protein [Gaiellaceae bacterium]
MSAEGESLKDEMSQLFRADRERAQERRASAAAEPAPEPAATPEQTPRPEPPRRRRFFR